MDSRCCYGCPRRGSDHCYDRHTISLGYDAQRMARVMMDGALKGAGHGIMPVSHYLLDIARGLNHERAVSWYGGELTKTSLGSTPGPSGDMAIWAATAWSTDSCHAGAQLVEVPGSACFGCYARQTVHTWSVVRKANHRRLHRYMANPVMWAAGLLKLIQLYEARQLKLGRRVFIRHAESGDLYNQEMLGWLWAIAYATPDIRYWQPSKETAILKWAWQHWDRPRNFQLTPSGYWVNGMLDQEQRSLRWGGALCHTEGQVASGAFECPYDAGKAKNCGTCADNSPEPGIPMCFTPALVSYLYRGDYKPKACKNRLVDFGPDWGKY